MNKLQQTFLLLIICFIAFFFSNDLIPANIMEARNFATAREILETKDWLIPHMNGMLRLEKRLYLRGLLHLPCNWEVRTICQFSVFRRINRNAIDLFPL